MPDASIPLPRHVPLVVATRGDRVESVHYGSVAVCNAAGELLLCAGDWGFPMFTRSTLKPFQALPFVLDGGPAHFGFTLEEVALLSASHSGEARHVAGVASMLHKAGVAPTHLQCGCHVPLHYAACGLTPPPDLKVSALHHNCSGKHAGFLAGCRLHGLSLDNYLEPNHPLQRRIRDVIAAVCGCEADDLSCGIDGCGAPNYALPLRTLARGYARLATERSGEFGPAFATLYDAMTGAPEMVSGRCRSDAALMQAAPGDWVAKAGAEGVQALGLRAAGIGVALKVSDGNPAALRTATVAVLSELGALPAYPPAALRQWSKGKLRNHSGTLVGRLQAVFRLERPAS